MPEWLNVKTLVEKVDLVKMGTAFGVLVGGWIVCFIVQKAIFWALCRTDLDDRIAQKLGVREELLANNRLERLVSKTIYWMLLAILLVIFFSVLGVKEVTQPLLSILNEVASAVPNLMKAVFLGIAGFLVATVVRSLLTRVLDAVGFDKRMAKLGGEEATAPITKAEGKKAKKEEAKGPSRTIANIAYWFILVVAAIPVLEALKIGALAGPLSNAFQKITSHLPNVGAAVVLFVIGYVVARVAKAVVVKILSGLGVDKALQRFGIAKGQTTLSGIVGTVVMAFILLQFSISAIGRLGIEEISKPAGQILERVYAYLPKLLVGIVLMTIGVIVARLAGNVAGRLLAAIGFNSLMSYIGVAKEVSAEAKAQEEEARLAVEASVKTGEADEAKLKGLLEQQKGIRTPSDVVGVAVGSVIALFFLRQVLSTLELEGMAKMVDTLIAFLPNIFVACVVLGAGLWAGRWAKKRVDELTARSEDRAARALGTVARVVIIAFAAMVSLQQLGVGQNLILVAFALVFGAVCLAAALAFGLGGREAAARLVSRELERRRSAPPPVPPDVSGPLPIQKDAE